jgi:hypothetical protein
MSLFSLVDAAGLGRLDVCVCLLMAEKVKFMPKHGYDISFVSNNGEKHPPSLRKLVCKFEMKIREIKE